MRYRDTYVNVNLKNIEYNIKTIISKYNNYEYYFGVVKADCYGHENIVKAVINGGCNYLAVAMLEEALNIREYNKEIPILCLGIIPIEYLDIAQNNNVTVTINSFDYANKLVDSKVPVKVHIKLNTGMNRLGIKEMKEFIDTFNLLINNNIEIEGIYTHIYNSSVEKDSLKQLNLYKEFIDSIDKSKVKIFHACASDALTNYQKMDFVNGCRLGIIMYGFNDKLALKSTFSLHSKIIQINKLKCGETLGYNAIFKANDDVLIGVVPIGYADGIIRKNTGRYVYINDKKYPIVGNICMDMLFVKIDESVKIDDEVILLKDNEHIKYTADYLDTIVYEVMCSISKRVPRIYR